MITVCGVRHTPNGKVYMFDPRDFKLEKGDFVVVDSSHGQVLGEVAYGAKEIEKLPEPGELRPVLRLATDDDLIAAAENEELAGEAFNTCKQLIAKQGLDMKLFRTEYTLDRSKAIFYYVSEQRVDFRNLVKELAPRMRVRIEMVQVGPREHAKAIGGIGVCGRQFCCKGFMTTFEPVTIKMAKDQGLTSNPAKYSGNCGKLLCCIRHEEAAYEYAHGIMPKNGSLIMTEDGPGRIIVVNMLKETCTVKVGLEQNFEIKSYGVESIRALTESEKADYMALRKKEKEEMEAETARRQALRNEEDRSGGDAREGDTRPAGRRSDRTDENGRGDEKGRRTPPRRRDEERTEESLNETGTEDEAETRNRANGEREKRGENRPHGRNPKFRKGRPQGGNPENRGIQRQERKPVGGDQASPEQNNRPAKNKQGHKFNPGKKGPRDKRGPKKP